MLFDTHVHTDFSFDCDMPLAKAIASAKEQEAGICITDHLDLNMDYKAFDPEEYARVYHPLQEKGLLIGIECGMDPRYVEASRAYVSTTSRDFTLGSVHTIGDDDIYFKEIYEKYSRDEFWPAYFRQALECLKTHPFVDSIAHLDYPARVSPYGESDFGFRRLEKDIIPVYEYLIAHDTALELNLRRFSPQTLAEFKEHFSVYRELGGRYVTLGTDSHQGTSVGRGLREAFKLLDQLGLRAVHFERHEIVIDRP